MRFQGLFCPEGDTGELVVLRLYPASVAGCVMQEVILDCLLGLTAMSVLA